MNLNLERLQKIVLFLLLFTLIMLWNIPHTIAGRYICEGLLLVLIFANKPHWKPFFQENKALAFFFIYLLLQLILFSKNYPLAFSNFRAEWMHFILFSIIGAGVGLLLGNKNSIKTLLFLGVAFSTPLYIHLVLSFIKGFEVGSIPWGYWGINEIHGDLGYTALQASIFLFTYFLYQAKSKLAKLTTIGLLIICVCSPLLAASRGGTGFVLIAILFISLTHFFIGGGNKISLRNKFIGTLSVLILIAGAYQVGLKSDPNRWGGILSRISLGFEGDPGSIYCEGIGSLEAALKSKGVVITPAIQKGLDSIIDGDGARVMAARSGASLTLENPMGIDQSKQAYQQAITKLCNGKPAIFISHTHNAWVDTALAIGLPGAALLLLTLLTYMYRGRNTLRANTPLVAPFGMALFASASLWILRGLLDSVQRDQMLEMQAFVMALLLGIIITKNFTQNKNSGVKAC
ncbi:hypothetical protein [Polynucleobacter sp. 80A-SIGWE]|uniref:hypothetical protein n=1 Tax=Polynucleobacter sp. 80A-SIGWE TaxID=2689100 RepID=UPI001C0BB189|nr:hypothetical protein [Polynucleobacter sp. 80A-SIGWE]MBU3589019.1 hypothetical protein [Polynucleobacter sp. 80A-SIGWE]